MAHARPKAALRDYWQGDQGARVTALVDFEGEPEPTKVMTRIGGHVVRANNDVFNAITGIPAQLRDNWRMLRDPNQLRLMMRGLVDDRYLTARRRRAIFSILLWGSLMVWAVAGLVLAIVAKDALVGYQSGYQLFFYSLATSLFLPTPFELILSNAVGTLGVLWTVLIAAFAKVVGAWLVLLMGDKANEGLQELLEKRATLRRIFEAMMRFTRKYGYFAIFVLFAIPFMSDTAPLFVLAVMRMNKAIFLTVTFVAIVARSLLYIYAGNVLGGLF